MIELVDHAYGAARQTTTLAAAEKTTLVLELASSFHWYDFSLTVAGAGAGAGAASIHFARRWAGRVETGALGVSDPAMAGIDIKR